MGKRKSCRRSDKPQTLTPKIEEDDQISGNEDVSDKGTNGFFACYLLTSLSPRHKGQTYIGFTVNPRRRIRQHNGEIGSGAFRTKRKRPWEMVLCIYGFPTNVAALQFEWAWQHPVESLAVRKAAVEFKSLNGLANKIKLAYTMLTLPSWQSLNLTVNFFSTKYTKHYAGCPTLPNQMKVQVRSMDELPCYTGVDDMEEKDFWDDDEQCDETGGLNDISLKEVIENSSDPQDHHTEENAAPERWLCDETGGLNDISLNEGIENSSDPQDHHTEEDAAPERWPCVDENSSRQPSRSPVQSNWRRESFCSAENPFPLFSNCSYIGTREVSECTIELDSSPVAQTFSLPNDEDDQPPVKCPVEVIDVFSPSPEYNTLRMKRRSVSSVGPKIIDLTQSPIYV